MIGLLEVDRCANGHKWDAKQPPFVSDRTFLLAALSAMFAACCVPLYSAHAETLCPQVVRVGVIDFAYPTYMNGAGSKLEDPPCKRYAWSA